MMIKKNHEQGKWDCLSFYFAKSFNNSVQNVENIFLNDNFRQNHQLMGLLY